MKQPTPQVTQVAAWRTQDGELFATAHEANAHAAKLNFFHYYSQGNQLYSHDNGVVMSADMAAWLADNRAAVLDLLMARTDWERHAV